MIFWTKQKLQKKKETTCTIIHAYTCTSYMYICRTTVNIVTVLTTLSTVTVDSKPANKMLVSNITGITTSL